MDESKTEKKPPEYEAKKFDLGDIFLKAFDKSIPFRQRLPYLIIAWMIGALLVVMAWVFFTAMLRLL